jgi:putative ABC transport system substrate-binding protein
MRRREFISLIASAIFFPAIARAEKAPARIGLLGTGAADTSAIFIDALREGLRENGLIEGRDYVLDVGWAEGDYTRFPGLAVQMVKRHTTIILATTISAVRAAQRETTVTPIVMTSINDPVGAGLVQSLSRPGGNTTGLASLAEDVTTKFVELLHASIPGARQVAVLLNPANPSNTPMFRKVRSLLDSQAIGVRAVELKAPAGLEPAFATFNTQSAHALLILPDFLLIDMRQAIAAAALQYQLPTITNVPEYTDAGALLSYGAPRRKNYRRSAYYVKRILNGANPADLPVEQPTEIELSINLKTAKTLGLILPDNLVARADRVVE